MAHLRIRGLILAVAALAALPATARAASPPQTITAPAQPGSSTTVTWTGEIEPTMSAPVSDCDGRPADAEEIHIVVPPGTYDRADVEATFSIDWAPADTTHDEVLTVINPDVPASDDTQQGTEGRPRREIGSSDGSGSPEVVHGTNLPEARYQALACGFLDATPQSYSGTLTLTARAKEPPLASAPANGLEFSAAVPADPQRDEGEPLVQIDRGGRIYTCGPTGFSNAADYAQVSEDGGRQFHLLGEPPRGQQAPGGGGDCSLATSPVRNEGGFFNYAYSGLGPLVNFAVAASSDGGHTLFGNAVAGKTIPGVDRQWQTFLDRDHVLLNYNQQEPRQVVVQKSSDGGRTYDVGVAATPVNPSFPGPMRTLQTPAGPVAYFPFNKDADIYLAVSRDGGATWTNCKVATAPGDPTVFTTADHDEDGTIYVAYGENAGFHVYVRSLPAARLAACDDPVDPQIGATAKFSAKDPGWSDAVQVDRDAVRTTVFPWLTAGGAPGRIAVAFYGSESDGDPNTSDFKGSWNVYVNQSLDGGKSFSQVKATTHPVHYDSICLNGLGCDVSGGDRSLADFFAIGYSPADGGLHIVYDTAYKRPDDPEGSLATPTMLSQRAGPSLGGGEVRDPQGPALRDTSADASGDAISDYSSLGLPPDPRPEPAADFTAVRVRPAPDGGFTLAMDVSDLSDAALARALGDAKAQRLLWVFRWFNGYRSAAAVARWSPATGFSFGFNDFVTGSVQCGSTSDKCLQYPGDQPLAGKVDQATGRFQLAVPARYLKALSGGQGPGQRPLEVPAKAGDRLYDGTAFALADASPAGAADQSFLYPLDNAPAMDFLVPAAGPSGEPPIPSGAPAGGGACAAAAGLRGVAVRPHGRRATLAFERRSGATPVQVDVFQQSIGRRVTGERRVARFARRTRGFTWNGRANVRGRRVRDGYLFVRFSTAVAGGRDVRRVALRRVRGRLRARPPFQRRDTCALLRAFKLGRPVFGGRTGAPLGVSFRLSRAAAVRVDLLRGRRVVRRLATGRRAANRTFRLVVSARRLRVADYRVRLRVGGTTATLFARRL